MQKKIETLSDKEIVELVRANDKELYREIMRRYQAKLIRYASHITGDEEQAADAVQEAFIKAYINLYGFNAQKKFSSWLYRIVHNEAINIIKKYNREQNTDINRLIERIKTGKEDELEERFRQKEVKETVTKCLDSLPLKYREPLSLFYLEDKSYEEISDILRMPLGTVGTRINRGKKVALKYIQKNH